MFGGDLVRDAVCPGCKQHSIVYNGNYWCENESGCGWVMDAHDDGRKIRKRDKAIISEYLNQRYEEAEVKGDQWTMDHMKFYMDRL